MIVNVLKIRILLNSVLILHMLSLLLYDDGVALMLAGLEIDPCLQEVCNLSL
jgi:hypothetical protein